MRNPFFFMNLDIYEDFLYEFYSSLSVPKDENENIIEYIMSFRMRGGDNVIETKHYASWLDCDNDEILNTFVS